jgi:hypothetical protein
MQRPKPRISLSQRFKNNTSNGNTSNSSSVVTSRTTSPKRTMSNEKPLLLLRTQVLEVGSRTPRSQVPHEANLCTL